MKICMVTVTYGNRFKYLKQVIEAALKEGACKVIVIDNDSEEESKSQLKNLEKKLKDKLKVIYLPENTGSAGGFKRGLEEAYNDKDCEFIWLLDDDNVPEKEALKVLIETWRSIEIENKETNVALHSWRKDYPIYRKEEWEPYKNKIIKFSNIFSKFIFPSKNYIRTKELTKETVIEVPFCSYGGFFFKKELINKIGYPDENFYLYVDDTDFTYRVTHLKGKIFFVKNSIIKDLDTYWAEKKGKFYFATIDSPECVRVYYSIRNKIFFIKKYFVNNNLKFTINVLLYFLLLSSIAILKLKPKRIRLLYQAIKDGLMNNYGHQKNC